MAEAPLLTVENLSVGYKKDTPVLSKISGMIQANSLIGLVGLNGQGKSTFLKTILSLRDALDGAFTHEENLSFSYLPEKFAPPLFLTGLEFIRFSAQIYRNKDIDHQAIVKEAEKFDLSPAILKQKMAGYSKGMRQKVGLIAAMIVGANLTILDEPMSGLDPKARAVTKAMIQSGVGEHKSVLFSTHNLNDMEKLCDVVIIFHDGHCIFWGKPQEFQALNTAQSFEDAFLNAIS